MHMHYISYTHRCHWYLQVLKTPVYLNYDFVASLSHGKMQLIRYWYDVILKNVVGIDVITYLTTTNGML